MATVDVMSEITIGRPVNEVAEYAANPDNVPAWYVNIGTVEWKSPRPLQLGSQIAFVAQFLGKRLAYTYTVVEWTPGQRLVMRTSEGPFPMETTYEWAPATPGSTRMVLRNSGTPTGFSKWVAPFMAFFMRRANRKDLERLKQILEQNVSHHQ